jgi:hypothetical protein
VTRLATFVLALALAAGCSGDIPCDVPRDCPVVQRCVNHTCADTAGTANGALGEACQSNGECGSGLTCSLTSQGYPGGFCTTTCSSTSPCPTGATCTAIGTTQICAPSCTLDSQCRQSYACCATLNDACVPLAACPPAQCTRPVVASALAASQVQSFGTRTVNEVVTFTVPPNTGSVTIVQQAQIATMTVVFQNTEIDNSAVPLRITKPDGTLAYSDTADAGNPSPDGGEDPSGNYSFYGGSTPSTVAFTIPNTTASLDGGVPAGNWTFVVNDFANECAFPNSGCNDGGTATNTYDVSVLTRPLPAGNTGTMDVVFYIVADMTMLSGLPFTAANAASDPQVQRMVQAFTNIMSGAGISVNVTFQDTTAADRARFGTNVSAQDSSPCSELNQMFTLSGQHPGNTLNLFLVQSLRSANTGSGGTIVGIDGTIPGPSSLNGTVHSGAVVSSVDLFASNIQNCGGSLNVGSCGPDRVGYVAAHETGHFLGLFHTTEQEGADFDPLTDTPKCPCTACASPTDRPNCGSTSVNSPTITADRCVSPPTCGGGDNLMFWFLQQLGVQQGTLTPQQGQVMRLNALVH